MACKFLAFLMIFLCSLVAESAASGAMLSSRLIYGFSEEVKARRFSKGGNATAGGSWPERRSLDHYRMLAINDVQRKTFRLGPRFKILFPYEGTRTMQLGNDFAWLHYIWIDIGTPNVPFLVALDAGSDLLWVPCNCVRCAPLSGGNYSGLDRDLNEYSLSLSRTSKHLPCSHRLCMSVSECKNFEEPCPYTVSYDTENTSSSGLLVEDVLHLASGGDDASNSSVRAPVIIGCGMKQSGGYLEGIAPDGLMGLGLGEISVPSYLSKKGLVRNSFSLCFDGDDSGRIFFGELGTGSQQFTSFLPFEGKYKTYIVGVEACCIRNSCLNQTGFRALVDSGSSFTYLPNDVYEKITAEFDRHMNATRASFNESVWAYCYKLSSNELPKIPSVTFVFPLNNSFVVHNPVFVINGKKGVTGFCLAVQPADGEIGIIGQNFMTGYHLVFDRENLKLRWSESNCGGHSPDDRLPLAPSGTQPLPTDEQQRAPSGHAVGPAVAGRARYNPSAASSQTTLFSPWFLYLLALLLLTLQGRVSVLEVDVGTV